MYFIETIPEQEEDDIESCDMIYENTKDARDTIIDDNTKDARDKNRRNKVIIVITLIVSTVLIGSALLIFLLNYYNPPVTHSCETASI